MSASDFLTALGTGIGLLRAVYAPAMTLRFTEVRCAAAHMGAALQGIFVGEGPFALPGSAEKLGSGRCRHRPLWKRISGCVGEGLCPSRGRGNRRSAAGGRRSEAVSRKCPDWRPQQWPGIGWDDGGQENPAPTERNKRCGKTGRRGRRPLRTFYCGCGGAGDREGWPCRLRRISGNKYGDGLPQPVCALASQ